MTKRLDIAMIMDGNRRWAIKQGLPKTSGHEYGAKKLKEVLEWCKEIDAASLTLYTFSTENFNRSEEEKNVLFSLCRKYFADWKNDSKIITEGVKIKFIGDLSLFPQDIQDMCAELEEKTSTNTTYLLQLCFGYGGRHEITQAVKAIISKGISVESITEDLISSELYSSIEPDIVIRTSGEQRLSNFLPWQTTYSELFFVKNHWPAFTKKDFLEVIHDFTERQRRKGV